MKILGTKFKNKNGQILIPVLFQLSNGCVGEMEMPLKDERLEKFLETTKKLCEEEMNLSLIEMKDSLSQSL